MSANIPEDNNHCMKTVLQIITIFISGFFFAQAKESNIIDINPNQKEINKKQDFVRNYLINFLETKYEKQDGFYLLTEKKSEEGNTLEMSTEPTFKEKDIKEIKIVQNGKYRPFLQIYFKPKAQHRFSHLISNNVGNGIATIVDKKIIMMTPIERETSRIFIEIIGMFTLDDVRKLKSKLEK